MYYKETYLLFIVVLKRRLISWLSQKFPNLTTRAVRLNEYDMTVGQIIIPETIPNSSGVPRNLEDLDLNRALFIRPDKQICDCE